MSISADQAIARLKMATDDWGLGISISRCRRMVLKYIKNRKHIEEHEYEQLYLAFQNLKALMEQPPVVDNSRKRERAYLTSGKVNPRGLASSTPEEPTTVPLTPLEPATPIEADPAE